MWSKHTHTKPHNRQKFVKEHQVFCWIWRRILKASIIFWNILLNQVKEFVLLVFFFSNEIYTEEDISANLLTVWWEKSFLAFLFSSLLLLLLLLFPWNLFRFLRFYKFCLFLLLFSSGEAFSINVMKKMNLKIVLFSFFLLFFFCLFFSSLNFLKLNSICFFFNYSKFLLAKIYFQRIIGRKKRLHLFFFFLKLFKNWGIKANFLKSIPIIYQSNNLLNIKLIDKKMILTCFFFNQ